MLTSLRERPHVHLLVVHRRLVRHDLAIRVVAVPAAACIAAEVPRVPGVELRAAIKTFDPRRSSQQFRHDLGRVWGYLVGGTGAMRDERAF